MNLPRFLKTPSLRIYTILPNFSQNEKYSIFTPQNFVSAELQQFLAVDFYESIFTKNVKKKGKERCQGSKMIERGFFHPEISEILL